VSATAAIVRIAGRRDARAATIGLTRGATHVVPEHTPPVGQVVHVPPQLV
jgi:hypothetical protein